MKYSTFYISEIFTSIQGEGRYTGMSAHFIRFQGCPIKCHFCDTPGSIVANEKTKIIGPDLQEIIFDLEKRYPNVSNFVLTGGEPLYNNPYLTRLIGYLVGKKYKVHIETSGIYGPLEMLSAINYHGSDVFLTVSPKAANEDDKEYIGLAKDIVGHAKQIKFPVSSQLDLDERIPRFLEKYGIGKEMPLYLQPVSGIEGFDTTSATIDYALATGMNVSCQVHKFLHIR